MTRKNYATYWGKGDIYPINESQRKEIAEIKADFVNRMELITFKKGDRVTLDPYFRHLKMGEGDYSGGEVLFKWGPWEFSHIMNWVRSYLKMIGFVEVYHFMQRAPVGAIEFLKE